MGCRCIHVWGRYKIRRGSPAKHFSNKILVYEIHREFNLPDIKISSNPLYPKNPKTFGEKLRKWRMDKGLLIKDLAKMIGVTPDTIMNWEKRNVKPYNKYARKIKKITSLKLDKKIEKSR